MSAKPSFMNDQSSSLGSIDAELSKIRERLEELESIPVDAVFASGGSTEENAKQLRNQYIEAETLRHRRTVLTSKRKEASAEELPIALEQFEALLQEEAEAAEAYRFAKEQTDGQLAHIRKLRHDAGYRDVQRDPGPKESIGDIEQVQQLLAIRNLVVWPKGHQINLGALQRARSVGEILGLSKQEVDHAVRKPEGQ